MKRTGARALIAACITASAVLVVPDTAQAAGLSCNDALNQTSYQIKVCIDANQTFANKALGVALVYNRLALGSTGYPITVNLTISTQICPAGNINNCTNVSGTVYQYYNWDIPAWGQHRFEAGTASEFFGNEYRGCVIYSIQGGPSGGGCSPLFA